MQLILASNSPRRRELLLQCGIPFTVVPSRYEEKAAGLSARGTVLKFAQGKAEDVFSRNRGCAVLGADTVVCLGGEILGKPKDKADARRMLRALSGRTHSVFTGVCLIGEGLYLSDVVETEVTFYPLGEELIRDYVEGGSPMDKAGAYGIQDGVRLVSKIAGSYTNVMGLPMELTKAFLKEGNIC